MSRIVTVYRPSSTDIVPCFVTFSGPDVAYLVQSGGGLSIKGCRTDTDAGSAYFAAGHWAYVAEIESISKVRPPPAPPNLQPW